MKNVFLRSCSILIALLLHNHLFQGIKRGSDGRLHISRDLTDRYGKVNTYSIIDGGDFDERWRKDFRHECTHRWQTYQKPVEMLSDAEFSHNKVVKPRKYLI